MVSPIPNHYTPELNGIYNRFIATTYVLVGYLHVSRKSSGFRGRNHLIGLVLLQKALCHFLEASTGPKTPQPACTFFYNTYILKTGKINTIKVETWVCFCWRLGSPCLWFQRETGRKPTHFSRGFSKQHRHTQMTLPQNLGTHPNGHGTVAGFVPLIFHEKKESSRFHPRAQIHRCPPPPSTSPQHRECLNGFSVAFCSPAKSLTFSGLVESPLVGKS